MTLELYLFTLSVTHKWEDPATMQKSNKKRFEALSPSERKNLRELGYSNRGTANIRASHDLLNKYHPKTPIVQPSKVKVTVENETTLWVDFSDGEFIYTESDGGVYSRSLANDIAGQVQKVNPNINVEVVDT